MNGAQGWYAAIVTCSAKFYKMIANFLNNQQIEYRHILGIKDNYHNIFVTKKEQALKFLECIYNNPCKLKLKRKYEKYCRIKELSKT